MLKSFQHNDQSWSDPFRELVDPCNYYWLTTYGDEMTHGYFVLQNESVVSTSSYHDYIEALTYC